ncbi:MAG: hypothetical protein Q9213_001311 [Squamulea squamosa]
MSAKRSGRTELLCMTKPQIIHADWPRVASRLLSSASQPSAKLLQASYEPAIALCNLSPFNPYWPSDPFVCQSSPPPPLVPKSPSLPSLSHNLSIDLDPCEQPIMHTNTTYAKPHGHLRMLQLSWLTFGSSVASLLAPSA